MKTEAYVLEPDQDYDHKKRIPSRNAELKRREIEIPDIKENEVRVKVLSICMEGNMGHAYERRPIDICHDRKEPWCIAGNAGAVQIVETGKEVKSVQEGDQCIVFCNGKPDKFGYPEKIYAYDHPGSYGLLARETKLREDQLIKIPEKSNLTLEQWAAFSLRGITAYANWRVALHTFRGQVEEEELPSINVGAWGGGVSLLEAQLAASYGHNAFMISSSKAKLDVIAQSGIIPIDRNEFPHLNYVTFKAAKKSEDKEAMKKYNESEELFRDKISRLTHDAGVHIFIDYVGEPVFKATLAVMARQGVITTAGWKEGMMLEQVRAIECIQRLQRVNTHYARRKEGEAAVQLALEGRMTPIVDPHVYNFDTIPQMFSEYVGKKGTTTEEGYYSKEGKEILFFPVARF